MSQRKNELNNANLQRLEKLFSSNRDLTLSSSSKSSQRSQPANNKKSVAPNLNVSRATRSKDADSDKLVAKKDDIRQRRNREEKSLTKKGKNYIQSFGFLSEGIAHHNSQRKYEPSRDVARENGSESIARPKIIKQEEFLTTKNDFESEQILANLIGDDEGDCKSIQKNANVPVKIKKYVAKSEDIKIKQEPSDGNEFDNHRNYEFPSNDLMIFQFPDTLPGKTMREDEEDNEDIDEKSTISSNLLVNSKMPKLYSLPNVDEGLIGKVVRFRSGTTKFMLGDTIYNIERGVSSEFQQNVVVIDPSLEERSTNIYNLGPIKAKYVCSPDWKWLFQKVSE